MSVFKLLAVAGGAVLAYALVLGVCLSVVDFSSWYGGPRAGRDRGEGVDSARADSTNET